jgi:hypothetical protein
MLPARIGRWLLTMLRIIFLAGFGGHFPTWFAKGFWLGIEDGFCLSFADGLWLPFLAGLKRWMHTRLCRRFLQVFEHGFVLALQMASGLLTRLRRWLLNRLRRSFLAGILRWHFAGLCRRLTKA